MTDKADDIDILVAQWQQQGVSDDLQPMAIFGRFARLAKHIEAEILRCHSGLGLGQGEFDVLATLRRNGAPYTLSPSHLYQSMMLSSGAMTSRLDRLAQKGLIERQHSTEDRRAVHVSLSDAGKVLIDRALPVHMALFESLLADMGSEERGQLNLLLKQWLGHFE
ncbi:MarR family winged helix-turn-helix transcriptional regulator [Shewanella salipaludis]|uniref:MarR family transcriptional regulator n=1 Tax=Shewanella salipaludis TaxID=2723052 RepID=A0A972JJ04_9GAMM|nr:MarR family transcriptional regulator [Shewanella salipaludis]NMH64610.1 MarR family transcriptional regulator [Shewanella salipaludis]